jgi:hypothetical protein
MSSENLDTLERAQPLQVAHPRSDHKVTNFSGLTAIYTNMGKMNF